MVPAGLDAHAPQPEELRDVFKRYQKISLSALEADCEVIDFNRGLSSDQSRKLRITSKIPAAKIHDLCNAFDPSIGPLAGLKEDRLVYEYHELPGLLVAPSLLPQQPQLRLLSRLLHRDLSDPHHKTNVHMFWDVDYPDNGEGQTDLPDRQTYSDEWIMNSFFKISPSSTYRMMPKDSSTHKGLTISQFLRKKLHWITLGGQYDWTNKVYPSETPPSFPPDIADLLQGFFPDMKAQAAIVNVYSPGDLLSIHRDVSEECDKGLISLSLGCDGIFLIGLAPEPGTPGESGKTLSVHRTAKYAVLRLRSGDVVYMSKAARFAWHGVPQILAGTCPEWMRDWPDVNRGGNEASTFHHWKGWMSNKRINLNVRQMFDVP